MKIATSAVVFREDLYPRLKTSPEKVQEYAEDLNVLPTIEINQHNELIDGWHRWTAHKKNEMPEIDATVTETKSDAELLELAIARNASHGLQLSQEDKRDMARKIYHITPEKAREAKKKELARILSVGERTVRVCSFLARM
jgi:ParB-like chromosome segregation protein Spo0J